MLDADDREHGTLVLGAAVSERDGEGMYGVAYGANAHLAYFDVDSVGNGTSSADVLRRSIAIALAQNASVINNSWNSLDSITDYSRDTVVSSRTGLAEVMRQQGTDPADKKIIVWGAGNDGFSSPATNGALGIYFSGLDHVLVAVAVDRAGNFPSSGSNRCGVAKNFCLAAPGTAILPIDNSDGYGAPPLGTTGTSIAAPMVSGALLVMREYFRGMLGNTELARRVLATANKSGRYSDDDTYGHGLLDLDAATRPRGTVGSLRVLTGDSVGGISLPLVGTELGVVGGAAGDALKRAFSEREFAFVDELDAPFFLPAEGLIKDRSGGDRAPDLFRLAALGERSTEVHGSDWTLRAGIAPKRGAESPARITRMTLRRPTEDGGETFLSLREHPGRLFGPFRDDGAQMQFDRHTQLAAPWMGFTAGGIGAGSSVKLPSGGRFTFGLFRGAAMFPGDYAPDGESNLSALMEAQTPSGLFSFQAGYLRESETALGIDPKGAMGRVSGRTFFAGATLHRALSSNWSAAAAAFVGRTGPSTQGHGVIRDIDALVSSSFGLALRGSDVFSTSDALDLSVGQPLRIETGSARIRLPAGRTRYGGTLNNTLDARLEPSGREIDLRGSYSRTFGSLDLRATAGWVEQRGHVRARDGEPYGLLELRRTF